MNEAVQNAIVERRQAGKKKRVPCSNGMNRNVRTVYATVRGRLHR